MTRFVNYKKRSFTLPLGCKDLIDVLAPARPQKSGLVTTGDVPRVIGEECFPTEGLAQIQRHVSMLLTRRGEILAFSVTGQDLEFPVTVFCRENQELPAIVLVTAEVHREQAIRAFFEQRGVQALRGFGGPDKARGLIYPLRGD